MSVGIADHRVTKGSPPCNSNTKTSALTRMMTAVTTERCRGRRDASPSGIMVPMLSSTIAGAGGEPRSCVSSQHRRRGTYTYGETLQLALDLLDPCAMAGDRTPPYIYDASPASRSPHRHARVSSEPTIRRFQRSERMKQAWMGSVAVATAMLCVVSGLVQAQDDITVTDKSFG